MKKKPDEFASFNDAMQELLKVPHSEIKAQLDKEKAEKKAKKRKPKTSASDHASGDKD